MLSTQMQGRNHFKECAIDKFCAVTDQKDRPGEGAEILSKFLDGDCAVRTKPRGISIFYCENRVVDLSASCVHAAADDALKIQMRAGHCFEG